MSDRLLQLAEELVDVMPSGPSSGQLRARLRSRRRQRLALTAVVTLLVIVNGLAVLALRDPAPTVPAAPIDDPSAPESVQTSPTEPVDATDLAATTVPTSTETPASTIDAPTTGPDATAVPVDPTMSTSTVKSTSPIQSAPVAVDDLVTTTVNTPIRFSPVANDSDPDGGRISIDRSAAPDLDGASIEIIDSSIIEFRPPPDAAGVATFTYMITDPEGLRASATVTVVITGPPAPTP